LWEESVIEDLKEWIKNKKITIEEAFKCFDRDFDGIVDKADLKWGLINVLNVKEADIQATKLERLFRLLDFYKTGGVQLSDF
jgi:Ca2+-binding EF-hand superfamily protein